MALHRWCGVVQSFFGAFALGLLSLPGSDSVSMFHLTLPTEIEARE
jgi:hypothetical protein